MERAAAMGVALDSGRERAAGKNQWICTGAMHFVPRGPKDAAWARRLTVRCVLKFSANVNAYAER